MATPRQVRRLAFQTLYQLDARGGGQRDDIRASMDQAEGYTASERNRAWRLAEAAYEGRDAADRAMEELAPTWPASRQAAVDRAILRLAHHEMTSGGVNPKIAVNEAVELAKVFSTEKSPAFINGLLDKILKRVLGEPADEDRPEPTGPGSDQPSVPADDTAS